MKRIVAALVVVALQLGVLGYIVYEREWTLRTGEVVYLRTMPIDPRDPFRGDYVALSYEINHLSRALLDGDPKEDELKPGMAVYAVLNRDARGVATVSRVVRREPSEGLFIRGRLDNSARWRFRQAPTELAIKYGVEKLFLQQGRGRDIEQRRGQRRDWQTPMEIEVAISSAGTAVIRDFRWSDIATRLEDLTQRPTEPAEARASNVSPHLRLSFRNDGQRSIALVLDQNGCSFALEAADGKEFEMLLDDCAAWKAGPGDVVVLQPGDETQREFRLDGQRWHIKTGDFSGPMGELQQWRRFRLVYRPPVTEQLRADITKAQGAVLWTSSLLSPAFGNRGGID